MQRLAEQILEQVAGLREGASVSAKELLHLGTRAAVDQALSRLVKRGQLLRAGRGLYVRPVETRFGQRPPSVADVAGRIGWQAGGEWLTPSYSSPKTIAGCEPATSRCAIGVEN